MTGMRLLASAVVIGLPLLGLAPGQQAPTRPAAPESPAAASLIHSAYHLKFLPDAPARQYRLRALAMAAAERDPASPQAADLLALIYRSSPDPSAPLAEALEKTLASRPDDFGLAWQWLNARVARTHTARERLALLTATAERADLGADLRAEAAAQAGLVLEREGEGDKARALFAQALSLDPWNAVALARPDALGADPAAQVRRYVRLLQGTVAQTTGELGPVAPLAAALDAAGLHEPSLTFFEEAWRWARRGGSPDAVSALAVPYLNAVLDTGDARQAVALFAPLEKDFADNVDFRFLLGEACQLAGDAAGQARQVAAIERLCPPLAPATTTPGAAVQRAMLHLLLQPKPEAALAEADHAQRGAGKDPDQQRRAQRVLGAAQVASGKPDLVAAGEANLKALLGQDPYAAVFLAAHYFATAREGAGKETLEAGAANTQSGPAFRRLRALAKEHGLTLPEAKDAAAIRTALADLDPGLFQRRAFPQRYLSVALRPLSENVAPGEPIYIEARLTNISKTPVPLGGSGLLVPTLALRARILPSTEKPISDLPLLVWPAPRMLRPGQTLTEVVRIDVGPLADFLDRRPLEDIDVTVEAVLSPDGAGQSMVPDVTFVPAKLHRTDLMGSFDHRRAADWVTAYQQTLVRVSADIRAASADTRLLAARQTGMLLGLVRNIQAGNVRAPENLQEKLNKPLLLRMMITLLQDADEAVRAEMLTALQGVLLDESILRQLGPTLIEDPSPLVRLRLVELMGAAGLTGRGSIVQILASDSNERVRMMADGFIRSQPAKKPADRE